MSRAYFIDFTDEDKKYIRSSNKTRGELALEFDCTDSTICAVVNYTGRFAVDRPEGFVRIPRPSRKREKRQDRPKQPKRAKDENREEDQSTQEGRVLCPCCLAWFSKSAVAVSYGHRCRHNEPCPGMGTPQGDNCEQCARTPGSALARSPAKVSA